MRGDAYENMNYCLLVLAQLEDMGEFDGRGVGNSDIARFTRLSRQTVNKLMERAADYGYCSYRLVVWRQDDGAGSVVYAKRYSIQSLWSDTYRPFWAARFRNRRFSYGQ